MFETELHQVKEKCPLVHSITNYVTVNSCANAILAVGGSPIMADDIDEVSEITSVCSALVINIGTLNRRTVDSMIKAGKTANTLSIPVILDPVGAGASRLRTETVFRLLEEIRICAVRGNISEIMMLANGSGSTKGVDADAADAEILSDVSRIVPFAKELSREINAVVAITGKTDVIANEEMAFLISNGNPLMSKITGTGCMLSGICGAFVGANAQNPLDAVGAAVGCMGLAGELAYHEGIGTMTYHAGIIDQLSLMDKERLNGGLKLEIR